MADDRAGPVTLMDVAQAAGVSMATASRALNGSSRQVRPDLAKRVTEAAVALGYLPNAQAQAVAKGHSDSVGLVIADVADPYFSAIASGAMQAAEAFDLVVLMACTFHHPDRELDFVATFRRQRVRGIILIGSRTTDAVLQQRLSRELAACEAAGGRVALVSQAKLPFDTVLTENRAGARDLAQQLCDLGHRSFAILAGPGNLLTSCDRVLGFREGLNARGVTVPPAHVIYSDFTRDGGREAALQLLTLQLDVTCIFAVNDVMALGALSALRDYGLEPPSGISLAGFDDVPSVRDAMPSLSTVRLPLAELGATALGFVMEPAAPRRRLRRVAGEVILRESTPRVAAAAFGRA